MIHFKISSNGSTSLEVFPSACQPSGGLVICQLDLYRKEDALSPSPPYSAGFDSGIEYR